LMVRLLLFLTETKETSPRITNNKPLLYRPDGI